MLHPIRRGPFLIDLVDRYDDGYFGSACVADRLERLRPHSIIGCHDKNSHVSDLRAAGAHGCERLVARCVEEGELARFATVLDLHLIRTDVLGNASGFARRHTSFANGVEQACFAVIHVAHDGHDGGPADQMIAVFFLDHFHSLLRGFLNVVLKDGNTEFLRHGFDRGHIEGLGHRGDDSLEEQGFDDFRAFDTQHVSQLLNREVVLRYNDHFGPDLLGLTGSTQLHGPTTLSLPGGFFAALAHGRHWFGGSLLLGSRLGRARQACRQHHVFLFAGESPGLRGQ